MEMRPRVSGAEKFRNRPLTKYLFFLFLAGFRFRWTFKFKTGADSLRYTRQIHIETTSIHRLDRERRKTRQRHWFT